MRSPYVLVFALVTNACASVGEYERKRAVEAQALSPQPDAEAQARDEHYARVQAENAVQSDQDERDRAKALADASARAEAQRVLLEKIVVDRRARDESPEGMLATACSLKQDLDQFKERIDRERRVGRESGFVNRGMLHDLTMNKQDCEDRIAALSGAYRKVTGKSLSLSASACGAVSGYPTSY